MVHRTERLTLRRVRENIFHPITFKLGYRVFCFVLFFVLFLLQDSNGNIGSPKCLACLLTLQILGLLSPHNLVQFLWRTLTGTGSQEGFLEGMSTDLSYDRKLSCTARMGYRGPCDMTRSVSRLGAQFSITRARDEPEKR